MRVSCGKERMRAIAATRSSCGRERPEKKRASPRRRVTSRERTTLNGPWVSFPRRREPSLKRKRGPRFRGDDGGARLASFAPRAGHHLLEAAELVFLHEHGVLVAGIAAPAHVVAIVGEALLDDRHQVDVNLGVPRCVRLVEMEKIRADDVHAVRAITRAERDDGHGKRRREVLAYLG